MVFLKWSCIAGVAFVLQANLPNEGGISLVPSPDQRPYQEILIQDKGTEENPQLLLEERLRLIDLLQRFA